MSYLLYHLETERLHFRKLESSDFENWLALFEDEYTSCMLGMGNIKTARERAEKWFEWTFYRYEKNLGGQNVLILKETNELVGQCGLLVREIEKQFEIEIAYSILSQHRMKGYATEAAIKCRDFAFENKLHHRLISLIVPTNLNSKNVALKNGMSYQRSFEFNNLPVDLFQITEIEWKQKNLRLNP